MKKLLFLIISIFALVTFMQIDVFACDCVSIDSTLEKEVKGGLERSKAVFIGEAVEVSKNTENYGFTTKFKIQEFWKDLGSQEIVLIGDGSSCEYGFTTGQKYLVFAYEWNGKLTTSVCIPNRELEKAGAELKILGKGKKPEKDKS